MGRPKRETLQLATLQAAQSRPRGAPEYISFDADGSISIDASKLEVPSVVYDADHAWLRLRNGAISLFFAKSFSQRDFHQTRLELRYAPELFFCHFWLNSRGFHERLAEYVRPLPLDAEIRETDPAEWQADRDHSMWVNMDVLAHSGTEASLDFFHLSPSALVFYRQSGLPEHIKLVPRVRVITTSYELLKLLDQAAELAPRIEPLMKAATRGHHEQQ